MFCTDNLSVNPSPHSSGGPSLSPGEDQSESGGQPGLPRRGKSRKALVAGLCGAGAAGAVLALFLLHAFQGFSGKGVQEAAEASLVSHKVDGLVAWDGQYSYYVLVNPGEEEEIIVRSDGQDFSEDQHLLDAQAYNPEKAEYLLDKFLNKEAAGWLVQNIFFYGDKIYYFSWRGYDPQASLTLDSLPDDSLVADYDLCWVGTRDHGMGTLLSAEEIRAYDQTEEDAGSDPSIMRIIQESPNVFQYGSKVVFSNGSAAIELDLEQGQFQTLTELSDSYLVGYDKGTFYYVEVDEEEDARLYRWQARSGDQTKTGIDWDRAGGDEAVRDRTEGAELVCSLPNLGRDWTSLANITYEEGCLYYSDGDNVYSYNVSTGKGGSLTAFSTEERGAGSCPFTVAGDYLYCYSGQGFYQFKLDDSRQVRSLDLPSQLEEYGDQLRLCATPSGICWIMGCDSNPVYCVFHPEKENQEEPDQNGFTVLKDKVYGTAAPDYDSDGANDDPMIAVEVTLDPVFQENEESAVITGYDANGFQVWQHTTGSYTAAQLSQVGEIGIYGGRYYYYEGGSVVTLSLVNGCVIWKNEEFSGASAQAAYDETEGILYICGYFGPCLMAIDFEGNTLHRLEDAPHGYMWYGNPILEGDAIVLTVTDPNLDMQETHIYIDKATFQVKDQ